MKRKSFILSFVLVALIAVMALTGCDGNIGGGTPSSTPTQETVPQTDTPPPADSVQDIGQGSTVFRFEVTDNTRAVTAWNVHTDETTIGAALLAVGLIDGDPSAFGLMVKEVNGLKIDFDTDGSWWAFYIDGEMAMSGVDTTNIEAGKTYAFVYTPA